jgi:hypothetical protein
MAVAEGRFAALAFAVRGAGPRPEALVPLAVDPEKALLQVDLVPATMAGRSSSIVAWLTGQPVPLGETHIPTGCLDAAERALLAVLAGDGGLAHVIVRGLLRNVETAALDDEWMHVAGLLGLVGVELGDQSTAEAIRALLRPYSGLHAGVGYRSYVGPVALHVGRLAMVVGDWGEAELHLTKSLEETARFGAAPWTAVAQDSLATTLDAAGYPRDAHWATLLRNEANAPGGAVDRHRFALPGRSVAG